MSPAMDDSCVGLDHQRDAQPPERNQAQVVWLMPIRPDAPEAAATPPPGAVERPDRRFDERPRAPAPGVWPSG